MAFTNMMAIEYNMWMSIMRLISDVTKSLVNKYDGFNIIDIPVLPAYPRDLTNFTKPSIIVQKIGTENAPICFGGFVGQYYDADNNTDMDVFGINYESEYQIDICSDSNTQRSLITAILIDDIFNNIRFNNSGKISIYNYALSLDNPQFMGYAILDQEIDVQNLDKKYRSDNEYKLYNYDYATAIRFDISMLQVIVQNGQKLVDLSKPIKIGTNQFNY